MVRIAINGLGRIGRCVARALVERQDKDIELVAINGTRSIEEHVHLLQYDSVHGRFQSMITYGKDWLDLGLGRIAFTAERNPSNLPWKTQNIDIVLECTGVFKDKSSNMKHLEAGAKRVMISAPAKQVDATIVYGVNQDTLQSSHQVISVGSCTTNCLAPIVSVLHKAIGIERGFMTTIHAYTNDQKILDANHKDLRRARACGLSVIPTSTGAAKALGLVLPELEGKLDGIALRVPTPNVSMVDLTFDASKPTDAQTINQLFKDVSTHKPMSQVLDVCEKPLVSVDFNHSPFSSIVDATGTTVIDSTFCRVAAWYDNEWGFSHRMLDVARFWASL